MKYLALLLLGACTAPDEVGVQFAYGEGGSSSNFDQRPVGSFSTDGESWALMPFATWQIGERARHRDREEWHEADIEATRRLEVTTATGSLQPMPKEQEQLLPEGLASPPETVHEALMVLAWAFSLLLVGCAALGAKKAGLIGKKG